MTKAQSIYIIKSYRQKKKQRQLQLIIVIFIQILIFQQLVSNNNKEMNKQNSMAIDNELSTEINDSTKSYSSRFKQLKAIKSNNKCRYPDVLPFKLEKSAIVIQRFWRLRQVFKRKYYQQLIEELDISNNILEFQNNTIDNLIEIYEKDCNLLQQYFEESGKVAVEPLQKQVNSLIKQMAILTFKMQKRIIDQSQLNQLLDQLQVAKQRNAQILKQKEQLKSKLSGELQQEQEQYLRKIKEENVNLLRVSKLKHEAQKIMREKLIQTYKSQMKL